MQSEPDISTVAHHPKPQTAKLAICGTLSSIKSGFSPMNTWVRSYQKDSKQATLSRSQAFP
jgi:hypothetical protein